MLEYLNESPARERYIKQHLIQTMQRQSGKKRLRKKKAQQALALEWVLQEVQRVLNPDAWHWSGSLP